VKAVFALIAFLAAQVPAGLSDIGGKYGLKIEVKQEAFTKQADGYTVSGSTATKDAMEKYAALWIKEWQVYTPSVMTKAKVTRIVFCEGLKVGDQVRAAVPAFDLNAMYYDPKLGFYSPPYQRNVIHHEFFHMIDQRMGIMKKDPEWAALNPKDFKYGAGGKYMRTNGVGNLTTEIPGFLTPYATSALEEDKAELFSHLIVDSKFVIERIGKDPILAAKASLLKKRLQAFDPCFSDGFWPKATDR
jgi:hypothetical protein